MDINWSWIIYRAKASRLSANTFNCAMHMVRSIFIEVHAKFILAGASRSRYKTKLNIQPQYRGVDHRSEFLLTVTSLHWHNISVWCGKLTMSYPNHPVLTGVLSADAVGKQYIICPWYVNTRFLNYSTSCSVFDEHTISVIFTIKIAKLITKYTYTWC